VDPFYRLVWEDGDVFDYVNDQAELDRQIAARNPADVEGYRVPRLFRRAVSEGLCRTGRGAVPRLRLMIANGPGPDEAAGLAQRL
jgi:phytoene desaturase